jgi:uncharacterized membrane protein YecN with MAPEG domain
LSISAATTLIGAPGGSDKFERGAALFFRSLVWLLSGYIVAHKIFPIDLAKMHLLEMTGGEFLLLYFRTAIALVAAWFFASKAFAQPALQERDKLFCERWAALGLGIITIIACSVGMQFVEGEGVIVRSAKLLGSTVVWLLV